MDVQYIQPFFIETQLAQTQKLTLKTHSAASIQQSGPYVAQKRTQDIF